MSASEPGWDLYRSFLAVVAAGSQSGAARRLRLTQPTVARHVDQLEAALGRKLFLRAPGGLSPTEAAATILPHAEALAAASAALLRAAAAEAGRIAGVVRISASEVFAVERLPPVLADLRRRHPDLVIALAATNDVEDLLRRDADVAVRMAAPVQQALTARKVAPVALGLFARSDYLARNGAPDSIEALVRFDMIGYERETPALRVLLAGRIGFARAGFGLRADSQLVQLAMLRAGFGVGVCQVAIAARNPRLVRVLPDEFAIDLPAWVVMHEDLGRSPSCRAVFDALVAALA